jgi:hypothetical protein
MSSLYTLAALAAYCDGPAPLSPVALDELAALGSLLGSPATLRDVVAALERRPYGAPLDDLPRELVAPARLTRRFPALCPVARSGAEPCTLAFSGDERLGAVALACVCGCVEVRPAYAGALSSAPRVHTRRAASGAGWVIEPAPARSPYILDDSRWIEAADAVAAVARLGAALALVQGVHDER